MDDKSIPESFNSPQPISFSVLTESAAKETPDATTQIQPESLIPESPCVSGDVARDLAIQQAGIKWKRSPARRRFLRYAFPLTYGTLITLDRLDFISNRPTAPLPGPPPLSESQESHGKILPSLSKINLGQPLVGTKIEAIPSNWLPGAKRAYRSGIHEGADLFTTFGMPVLAIADGKVIRSDREFVEMPAALHSHLLAVCKTLRCTPPEILDRLRGRCLYVDHGITAGSRLVAIYAHLNSIAVEAGQSVKRGQMIATVGNSGTSAGVLGSREDAHLHLELRLQCSGQPETFFGAGMTETEIRQMLKEVFADAAA
jgi:murein DD-endopeptidase MepM/ murein hydrolase activator NlpD